jgi:hypothetical protein
VDRRYTDADVAADPSLRAIATRWLQSYEGSFAFLVGAKSVIEEGRHLSTSTLRGVLNCMLADATVINMPEPARKIFNAGSNRFILVDADEVIPPLQPRRAVRKRAYPYTLRMRTTFRKIYGISLSTNAKLVHMVDARKSMYVKYVEEDPDASRFRLQWGWRCNPHIYMRINTGKKPMSHFYKLLTPFEVDDLLTDGFRKDMYGLAPREWRMCWKCENE